MDVPLGDVELEEITAEEAFSILGNQTRMEILRELWRSKEPCSFGELQETVAPEDRGNFSYHLGKLTGHFVRKTDEGYSLRFAGEQVVRAVLSGTITSDPTIPPTETDERCLYCGEFIHLSYEEETLHLECLNCGGVIGGEHPDGTVMHFEFPPSGLLKHDYAEIMYAADVLYDSKISPMIKGICPECSGRVSRTYDTCSDHECDDSGLCPSCETRYEVWGTFECENCLYTRAFPIWYAALNHPVVTAFLYRHGLDEKVPFRKITWDNKNFMQDISGTLLQRDPDRFRVDVPLDSERLLVTLDDELNVLETEQIQDDSVPQTNQEN